MPAQQGVLLEKKEDKQGAKQTSLNETSSASSRLNSAIQVAQIKI